MTGTSGTTSEHHLGRDAAVGAGGVGLAEQSVSPPLTVATTISNLKFYSEHRKNENESGLGSNTLGTNPGNQQNTTSSSGATTAGPHSSDLLNKADPRVDSDNSNTAAGYTGVTGTNKTSGHLGRDAAAAGTAGAVGEGVHHRTENEQGAGSGAAYTGTSQGSSFHTGPTGSAVAGV